MKSLLIRTEGPMIPGGYEFHDPITGKRYKDTHTFFNERVKQIINDRLANRRLFTDESKVDPAAVIEELSAYTCARLNHNPRYCSGGVVHPQSRSVTAQSVLTRTCPGCKSNDLKPIYCRTCSALKITGWKCGSCGAELPK